MRPCLSGLVVALCWCASSGAEPKAAAQNQRGAAVPISYPCEETLVEAGTEAAPAVDPRQLLEKIVEQMGGEKLDAVETLTFSRRSWHWRGPLLGFYEELKTRAYLDGRQVGRVDDTTIQLEGRDRGSSQSVAFVVNGDDCFKLVGIHVFASEACEASVYNLYQFELFRLLAPWIVLKAGAELEYAGLATIKTFEPNVFNKPDERGNGGHTDYQPVEFTCHKVIATTPPAFRDAAGATVTFWISPDDGRLLRFQCLSFSEFGEYGLGPVVFDVGGTVEVEGLRLPGSLQLSTPDNAARLEDLQFVDFALNVPIPEEELKRP